MTNAGMQLYKTVTIRTAGVSDRGVACHPGVRRPFFMAPYWYGIHIGWTDTLWVNIIGMAKFLFSKFTEQLQFEERKDCVKNLSNVGLQT